VKFSLAVTHGGARTKNSWRTTTTVDHCGGVAVIVGVDWQSYQTVWSTRRQPRDVLWLYTEQVDDNIDNEKLEECPAYICRWRWTLSANTNHVIKCDGVPARTQFVNRTWSIEFQMALTYGWTPVSVDSDDRMVFFRSKSWSRRPEATARITTATTNLFWRRSNTHCTFSRHVVSTATTQLRLLLLQLAQHHNQRRVQTASAADSSRFLSSSGSNIQRDWSKIQRLEVQCRNY